MNARVRTIALRKGPLVFALVNLYAMRFMRHLQGRFYEAPIRLAAWQTLLASAHTNSLRRISVGREEPKLFLTVLNVQLIESPKVHDPDPTSNATTKPINDLLSMVITVRIELKFPRAINTGLFPNSR